MLFQKAEIEVKDHVTETVMKIAVMKAHLETAVEEKARVEVSYS